MNSGIDFVSLLLLEFTELKHTPESIIEWIFLQDSPSSASLLDLPDKKLTSQELNDDGNKECLLDLLAREQSTNLLATPCSLLGADRDRFIQLFLLELHSLLQIALPCTPLLSPSVAPRHDPSVLAPTTEVPITCLDNHAKDYIDWSLRYPDQLAKVPDAVPVTQKSKEGQRPKKRGNLSAVTTAVQVTFILSLNYVISAVAKSFINLIIYFNMPLFTDTGTPYTF